MPSNAEQIQQLRSELDSLKDILSRIFDHRDMPMEVRREWTSLTRPARHIVESPVTEPQPPEKGEAQQALETIEQLQRVFEK